VIQLQSNPFTWSFTKIGIRLKTQRTQDIGLKSPRKRDIRSRVRLFTLELRLVFLGKMSTVLLGVSSHMSDVTIEYAPW
jgi:hypothetical protein